MTYFIAACFSVAAYIRNIAFNASIVLFSVCQPQTEPSGDTGSNFQSSDQYWTNSQWGTSSVSTARDQDQLTSAGDDYHNTEIPVAGSTSGQQPFSYWNVSASHTEVREC
jgi:hypothetical protein